MFTETRHVQQNQHCVCDYGCICTSTDHKFINVTGWNYCKDSCVAIKTIIIIHIHILILASSLSSLSVLSDIIIAHRGPSLKKMQDTDVQQSVLLLHNH